MLTHVAFSRTGGVAGVALHWRASLEQLPPADQQRLERLIDDARFFELPSGPRAAVAIPDGFVYAVEVDRDGRHHRVATADPVPEALWPLVKALAGYAKLSRRSDAK